MPGFELHLTAAAGVLFSVVLPVPCWVPLLVLCVGICIFE